MIDPVDAATRDRMARWRRSIADGEERNRLDSIARAAARSPGENIEAALALSAFVSEFAASLERDDEIAPAQLWRARCRGRP
jgi:hypothetical protein